MWHDLHGVLVGEAGVWDNPWGHGLCKWVDCGALVFYSRQKTLEEDHKSIHG